MSYRVKWVEDNLGVSRKALRNYERIGLMPKNEDSQYREYSDSDIERIWNIKQFQGMGYQLKDILDLLEGDEDFVRNSIDGKIRELETRADELECLIKYAKMIRLTGRIPSIAPGDDFIPYDKFLEDSKSYWNTDVFPDESLTLIDKVVGRNEDPIEEQEIGTLLDGLQVDDESEFIKYVLLNDALLDSIATRSNLSPDHPEVQMLVKMLHENMRDNLADGLGWSIDSFVRVYPLILIGGDLAKANRDKLGSDTCLFISNAIAAYAGYSNILEAMEGV